MLHRIWLFRIVQGHAADLGGYGVKLASTFTTATVGLQCKSIVDRITCLTGDGIITAVVSSLLHILQEVQTQKPKAKGRILCGMSSNPVPKKPPSQGSFVGVLSVAETGRWVCMHKWVLVTGLNVEKIEWSEAMRIVREDFARCNAHLDPF
jgi:hypothetical protein